MRILLATDQREASYGAIRLAVTLAEELGAEVEVLRVLEPIPVIGEGAALATVRPYGAWHKDAVEAALTELRGKLQAFGPVAAAWPKAVAVGAIPYEIVRAAERMKADLILLGAGRHAIQDRWLGTETAMRVTHVSHFPVLAVPAGEGERPRRLVAAVDFSAFSRDAIVAATRLCAPDAEVHLVRVLSPPAFESPYAQESGWDKRDREREAAELRAWAGEIGLDSPLDVHVHVVEGQTAPEILALAERVGADLITAGSHGRDFLGRLLFGSVATALIRRAHCAVLIAPPPEPAQVATTSERLAEIAVE
jgi:nucleotide-binding universal stress UspA family protein